MNRIKYVLITALAFSVMSTGCDTHTTIPPKETLQESTITIPEETNETFTEPETFNLLDLTQPYGLTQGLFYIANEYIEQGCMQQMMPFQEHILIWGNRLQEDNTSVLELALLNLYSGEVLHKATIPSLDIVDVSICDEQIIVSDWSDGDVYIFDETLSQTHVTNYDTTSNPFYFSTDGTQIYIFGQDSIVLMDLKTQTTTSIIENVVDLFLNTRTGNHVSFSYIDPGTQLSVRGCLNLEDGTYAKLPFQGSFGTATYDSGLWLAPTSDSENTYYLGKDGRPNMFTLPEGSINIDFLPDENRLLAFSYKKDGSMSLSLYHLDGTFVSYCDLGTIGAGLSYDPVWFDENNGYLFTITDTTGKDLLLFWDLSAPTSGTDLQLKAAYAPEPFGDTVSEELYKTAASFQDTYGITVKIAEQIQTQFYDFSAEQEYNEDYIRDGLTILNKVCSAYPDGFFKQLLYGNNLEIQFHLTGELTKTDFGDGEISGFTTFSGFTTEGEGRSVVAINIARPGSLEQTLHHEIAHLIDNKLTFDARIREDSIYSDESWEALNPENFKYANSYINLPMEFYNDGYENWFLELYSRTFIREDRATIMEYAMAGLNWAFSTPERTAKLDYWCTCIRDTFNTDGWPDTTPWEQPLSKNK